MSEIPLPDGYTLVRPLGRSPLSQVLLVVNDQGQRFALKVLRRSAARDPRLVQRFHREARLLEELHHPNLVQGFGALEVDGCPALLLEYIEGYTLRDALIQGPISWEQAARYGVQIARALDKLHRSGALHRDVKPHNVLIHPRRGAVLADLGLVRREDDPTLTRQGAALGSPAYMSPEQTRDPSGVGPEADVYSLGATLFHAMAGCPPFLGKGVGEVIHRVLHEDAEPLPDQVPEVVQRVLSTAMAKDPERRYARVRDFGSDLGRVLLGYPPRLITRYRRRRQHRLRLSAATLVGLGVVGWLAVDQGWLQVGRQSGMESTEMASANQDGPHGTEAEVTAYQDPALSLIPRYQSWAAPWEGRYQRAFEAGAYRVAWQALGNFAAAPLPDSAAAESFATLRREFLGSARRRLENRAAEIFVDVAEVLQGCTDDAQRAIASGSFDAAAWERSSLQRIEQQVPRSRQLPMFPGDENPLELVASYRLTLERRFREEWTRRAASLIPALRRQLDLLLRDGDLQAASQAWQQVDARLLDYSLEAQREGWRMRQLVQAEARLAAWLESRLGFEQRVWLRYGPVEGRVTLPAEAAQHWRLHLADGRRLPIRLLDLDLDHLDAWCDLDTRHRAWLAAQIAWCQGRGDEAVERMDTLALQEWEAVADPFFWAREWESQLASQVNPDGVAGVISESGEVFAAAAPNTDEGGVAAEDPLTLLQIALAEELRDARFERLDQQLVMHWQNCSFHPSWLRTFRLDRRKWKIVGWGVEWVVPVAVRPPDSLQLWGNLRLRREGRAWRLSVGEESVTGVRLVPGARQGFSWSGGDLMFDGFATLPWEVPRGRRLSLRAEASDAFTARDFWIVIGPVEG